MSLRGRVRRRTWLLALVAAIAAGAVAVSLSFGSSHREAPGTMLDPTADNTDVYAFTAKDAPNALTVVANWVPLEDPAGGPNFYRFDDAADYYINIDNTGDGKPEYRYLWKFKTKIRNKNSFLYALPGVKSFDDPKLNFVQTYTTYKQTYRNGRLVKSRVIGKNQQVAPNNVGPKTIAPADYAKIWQGAISTLKGGGKNFAGQADDPFFVDLGATFDAINLRKGTGNQGAGKDDLAGYNTHSIALQVPESEITRDGKSVTGADKANAVVGVWSSTDRQVVNLASKKSTKKGKSSPKKGSKARAATVRTTQVSRLGNPLVNEVIIPLGLKDQFNATTPNNDAQYGAFVVKPELAGVLNALFNLGIKETDRTDIVTALLTGIPGVTQIAKGAPPTDTIKINLGVPPNSGTENRFGVIGGDNAGFPNGRRLADDSTDIELRVIGGFLVPANQGGKKLPLGDGVDRNDVPFQATFPYVALPHDGFNSQPKRLEPTHAGTPGDLNPPAP